MKEEMFPNIGKSPHWREDHLGQRRSFGASEESGETSLQKAKRSETCKDGQCQHPALPSLRCSYAGAGGGWVLRLALQRSDLGRALRLAVWRQPERARV